jgi:hypothetical protein
MYSLPLFVLATILAGSSAGAALLKLRKASSPDLYRI